MERSDNRPGCMQDSVVVMAWNAKIKAHHTVTYRMPILQYDNGVSGLRCIVCNTEHSGAFPSAVGNQCEEIVGRDVCVIICKVIKQILGIVVSRY